MTRQSITLAKQNDEWLKAQIAEEEFTSKSEAVNYLIKAAISGVARSFQRINL